MVDDRTQTNPHPDPRGAPLGPGDRIHRYRLTALLGVGGMGVVYAADDGELQRTVAIKLLHHGAAAADRALREARAMAQFRHANVVPLFDVGVHQGQVYLVMPLLEDGTLGDWLRARPRPWREVVGKLVLAAHGLEAAHAAGLVHRDFKPDNVLLGAGDEVRVSDFGLARDEGAPATTTPPLATRPNATQTRLRGTPAYMAPEQLDGAVVDARADQFSFCVALHLALYGVRPFAEADGDRIDLVALRDAIRAGRMRAAPRDRGVPRWLAAILARGLREDPGARWPSMAALVEALERGSARGRRRAIRVGVGLVALALAAAIGFGSRRPEHAISPALEVRARQTPVLASDDDHLTRLTNLGGIDLAEVSPDGSQIAVRRGRELIIVPSAGGDPRVLRRDLPTTADVSLSWSPDGTAVLVHGDAALPLTNPYRLIAVSSGEATEVAHVNGLWGAMLMTGEIVSASPPTKALAFVSLDWRGPKHECKLPGTYQWIAGLRVTGSTIHVLVKYPHGQRAWLVTDRTCAAPRVVCGSDAIPLPGEHCVVLHKDFVIEVGADGRLLGRPRRVPLEATAIAGVTPDGAVILITVATTWRAVELSRTSARELGSGSVAPPELALAPDGRRLAITEQSRTGVRITRLASVDEFDDRSRTIASDLRRPVWSPDGTQLAGYTASKLAVVDVATRTRRELDVDDLSPAGRYVVWLDERRIAYLRRDHRSYRSIDIVKRASGDVLDPTKGWTFNLKRSSLDGSFVVWWNRPDHRGTWLVSPDHKETFVGAIDPTAHHAWSVDGRTLWLADKDRIEVYDPRTQSRALFRQIDLQSMTAIADLIPLDGDHVLLETMDRSVDLVRLGPGSAAR